MTQKTVRKVQIVSDMAHLPESFVVSGITSHLKGIKRWAYIKHDKDKYTEEEEAQAKEIGREGIIAGGLKPIHWHIILELVDNRTFEDIGKWFNLPAHMVSKLNDGKTNTREAFLDALEYLTHEDIIQINKGKHVYDRDQVVISDPNLWNQLDNYKAAGSIKATGKRELDKLLEKVGTKGYHKSEFNDDEYLIYLRYSSLIDKARKLYVRDVMPMPQTRMNFYIYGDGGSGKDVLSKALARSMFPDLEEDKCYYMAGAPGSTFDDYDGQPVIIWSDYRSLEIVKALGDRGTIFNVFDTVPNKKAQNIKYSSMVLKNCVNIVNSVEPYSDFIKGLIGSYTDSQGNEHKGEEKQINQVYRRFPIFIPIDNGLLTIMVNEGIMTGNADLYSQYMGVLQLQYNLQQLKQKGEAYAIPVYARKVIDKAKTNIQEVKDKMEPQSNEDYDSLQERIQVEVEAETAISEANFIPYSVDMNKM